MIEKIKYYVLTILTDCCNGLYLGPRAFGELGEGIFILESWGAMVNVVVELGSKLIVWVIYGALPKSRDKFEKSHLKGKTSILLDFSKKNIASGRGELLPPRPPYKM